MEQSHLTNTFLNQSKVPYWIIDLEFQLLYANNAYQGLTKVVPCLTNKLNDSIFIEDVGQEDFEKWAAHYKRAFKGVSFETEDYYYDAELEVTQYGQTTFEPLRNEENEIYAVACQWKNISQIVKHNNEAKQLMDSSLDVFCTFNEQGEFLYVNATAKEHWGYTPEELLGTNYRLLVIEEDVAATDSIDTTIKNGQEIKSFSNRYRKKDGGIAYNLWSSRWDKRAKLYYAVARDGKEKLEQEEKLLKSEQRFKALVTGAFDLVAVLDTEGQYLFMSPSITAISGIPPEEFIGKNAFDFVHPDDIKQTAADLEKAIKQDRVLMKPYRAKNLKNEWRWVESVLKNMLDNPAVKGIVVNSRDITDKVEQEEKIVEAKKRFEKLIENSTDCIIIISPEGDTTYISKAIKKILGYTPTEAMQLDIWELIHPQDIEGSKLAISKAMENPGVPIEGHTSRIKHKDGSWRWVKATVTSLVQDPSIRGIVDVISDVTKQKTEELEKELITKINNFFNQNTDNDLTSCLTDICKQIVEYDNFSFAEIWLPTFDDKKISRTASYTGTKTGRMFIQESEKLNILEIEEGLSDQVLKKRKIIIWESTDVEWHLFKRKTAAEKSGIKSLIAIPLIHNDNLLGGLLIGTEKAKSALSVNLDLFQKLKSALGSELSRKKTEVELSQIFTFTPDMICVAGFDGYIKQINPAGLALLGYSLEEIRSHPIKSFVYEEDQSLTEENQNNLYNGKNLEGFENRYITKEGKVIWLSWTATSLPEQGIIYAVAKDITEEKGLRELNRHVGLLAKIGSWEVDLIKQTVFWSDEVHRIYKTDPNSFVPTVDNAIDFYREDFRQFALSSFEKCIKTGEPYEIEAVIVTRNKKERWVRTTAKAEFNDGVCVRVYGSFQDINQDKENEIALRQSEAKFRTIFEIATLGIAQVDPTNGNILLVNSYYENITGYSVDELLKMNFLELTHPNDRKKDWEIFSKAARGEEEYRNEKRYIKKDGTIVWVKIHLAFIRDEKGNAVKTVAICEDVTKQKTATLLLNDSLKALKDYKYSLDQSAIIAFTDQKGVITSVNDNFCKISGYNRKELLGKTHRVINSNFHSTVFFKDLWKTIASGKVWRGEVKNKAKNGSFYWVDTTIVPFLDEKNNPKQYLAIRFDISERKKAEDEKARFQETLENSLNEIYMFNSKTFKFEYVNRGAMLNLGYTKQELHNLTPLDIKPEYTQESFNRLVSPLLNYKKDKVIFFTKHKRKDGSHYPVEVHLKLVEEDNYSNFIAIILDITERKKAEEDLINTSERLRLATKTGNIGIWDWDVLNDNLIWDDTMYQIFGVEENEFQGAFEAWQSKIHPDDIAEANKKVENALQGISKFNTEFRVIKHDKSIRYVTGDATVIRDEISGKPIRMIGTNIDITKRKKAEEENRFKANLLSMVRQGAIATDLNGEVNYWNKGAEIMYGWKAEEAIGKNIMQLTTLETNKEKAREIMERLKKGESWSGNFEVQKKDGTKFTAMITNSPIYDENKKLSGIIGISTDITHEIKNRELLKQYTKELERSNEELEQFAFVTSHDLQEPLRMISGFMDQLKRKYEDQLDEKALQYIYFATDGAKRMKQIILDLLDYSRASKPTDEVEEVNLNDIITSYEQLRRKVIAESSTIIISENLPSIVSYNAVVTQIFHGLLDNAIKYARKGIAPLIEIKVQENEYNWEFSVADNGIGIDAQFYDKIFVIFQRLHNRERYDGTGIGLAIVKRSVEFLDGKIWLTSTVGEGTTFFFTIAKNRKPKLWKDEIS